MALRRGPDPAEAAEIEGFAETLTRQFNRCMERGVPITDYRVVRPIRGQHVGLIEGPYDSAFLVPYGNPADSVGRVASYWDFSEGLMGLDLFSEVEITAPVRPSTGYSDLAMALDSGVIPMLDLIPQTGDKPTMRRRGAQAGPDTLRSREWVPYGANLFRRAVEGATPNREGEIMDWEVTLNPDGEYESGVGKFFKFRMPPEEEDLFARYRSFSHWEVVEPARYRGTLTEDSHPEDAAQYFIVEGELRFNKKEPPPVPVTERTDDRSPARRTLDRIRAAGARSSGRDEVWAWEEPPSDPGVGDHRAAVAESVENAVSEDDDLEASGWLEGRDPKAVMIEQLRRAADAEAQLKLLAKWFDQGVVPLDVLLSLGPDTVNALVSSIAILYSFACAKKAGVSKTAHFKILVGHLVNIFIHPIADLTGYNVLGLLGVGLDVYPIRSYEYALKQVADHLNDLIKEAKSTKMVSEDEVDTILAEAEHKVKSKSWERKRPKIKGKSSTKGEWYRPGIGFVTEVEIQSTLGLSSLEEAQAELIRLRAVSAEEIHALLEQIAHAGTLEAQFTLLATALDKFGGDAILGAIPGVGLAVTVTPLLYLLRRNGDVGLPQDSIERIKTAYARDVKTGLATDAVAYVLGTTGVLAFLIPVVKALGVAADYALQPHKYAAGELARHLKGLIDEGKKRGITDKDVETALAGVKAFRESGQKLEPFLLELGKRLGKGGHGHAPAGHGGSDHSGGTHHEEGQDHGVSEHPGKPQPAVNAREHPEKAADKDVAAEYLLYADIIKSLPVRARERSKIELVRVKGGHLKPSEAHYAKSLKELFAFDAETVHGLSSELRVQFRVLMEASGFTQDEDLNPFSLSESWSYWDLAKQYYYSKHKKDEATAYHLANPLTDRSVQADIVHRHFGWELYQKWQANGQDRQKIQNLLDITDTHFQVLPLLNKPAKANGTLSSKDLADLGTAFEHTVLKPLRLV